MLRWKGPNRQMGANMHGFRFNSAVVVLLIVATLGGCSDPKKIVLGDEPLKQMAAQGDDFRKLTESERGLFVGYVTVQSMAKALGGQDNKVTGRTVGEVLDDAKKWADATRAAAEAEKAREVERQALKARVQAENKAITDRINTAVTVALTEKVVLPESFEARRYSPMLRLMFAVENKSDKPIQQLKGRMIFFDPSGDKIGSLGIDFNQRIAMGATLKTDTGTGWKINGFMSGDIEKIAAADFNVMKTQFEPLSVAFEGGEVVRVPDSLR